MGRDGGADDPVRHTGAVRPGRLPWLQLCLDGAPQVTERCLLLDEMPEMEGFQLQGRLAAVGVELPLIVVSGQTDVTTTVRAMKAGAVDFIEKPYEADRLVEAIESAMAKAGRPTIRRQAAKAAARIAMLSPREREVLDGLVAGRLNKSIAFDLDISIRTIEMHRARMLKRLGTRRLAEAVRLAVSPSTNDLAWHPRRGEALRRTVRNRVAAMARFVIPP